MSNPFDAILSELSAMRDAGPYPCVGGCKAQLEMPGVCDSCAEKEKRRWHTSQATTALRTIPECFQWAKFGDALLAERCGGFPFVEAVRCSMEAMRIRKIAAFLLQGPSGTGKTSLACAMLRTEIDRGGYSASFVDSYTLGAAYRTSGLGNMPEAIRIAEMACVLVIDDVGSEDEQFRYAIRETVHARHAAAKPTIVTTWLSEEAICANYGDGFIRRIVDRAGIIQMPPKVA